MDVNETLRRLREAIQNEQIAGDGSYADEIAELFAALDEWLTRGGALPSDWNAK